MDKITKGKVLFLKICWQTPDVAKEARRIKIQIDDITWVNTVKITIKASPIKSAILPSLMWQNPAKKPAHKNALLKVIKAKTPRQINKIKTKEINNEGKIRFLIKWEKTK